MKEIFSDLAFLSLMLTICQIVLNINLADFYYVRSGFS